MTDVHGTRHLALVGPTATGKSALAMQAARAFCDIEIISLDSMQVYRGLDIGTAKPTGDEQALVRHHGIDLVEPDELWSVARTQVVARRALEEIEARGHRALFVGGTGLYVQAVIDGLDLPGEDLAQRAQLEAEAQEPGGLARLYAELRRLDPAAAEKIEPGNTRRIVRALEVIHSSGRPFSSFGPGLSSFRSAIPVHQVGVWMPRATVARRIEARVRHMITEGLVDEVKALEHRLGAASLSRTAATAIGYREILALLTGELPTLELAIDAIAARTRALARRQRMWFRRDARITWLGTHDDPRRCEPALLAAWAPAPTWANGARCGEGLA